MIQRLIPAVTLSIVMVGLGILVFAFFAPRQETVEATEESDIIVFRSNASSENIEDIVPGAPSGAEDTFLPTPQSTATPPPFLTFTPTPIGISPTALPPANVCSAQSSVGTTVNIRPYPGLQYNVIGSLPVGQYVRITGRSDSGWYQIDRNQGWVSSSVVQLNGPCGNLPGIVDEIPTIAPSPTYVLECRIIVTAASADVYRSPSTESGVLLTVAQGASGIGWAQINGWYQFQETSINKVGWILMSAVSTEGRCDILLPPTPVNATVAPTFTPTPILGCTVTTTENADMRHGPGTAYDVLATVSSGEFGVGWAQTDQWVMFVASSINKVGWVPITSVTMTGSCNLPPPTPTMVATDPFPQGTPTPLPPPSGCAQQFFFVTNENIFDRCPSSPAITVEAAYQAYENGYMLWRTDTNLVSAVGLNGWPVKTPAETYAGDPILAPDGFYAPEGVFQAWWDNEMVNDMLGWATGPIVYYTMQAQTVEGPFSQLMTLPDSNQVIAHTIDSSYVAGTLP